MPVFAHLDMESEVQVNDRTRIDASKSFVTNGEGGSFSNLTVKPGLEQIDIQIFATRAADRFLDWEFSSLSVDVDSTNDKIDFVEATVEKTASIAHGTYSLSELASEIQTKMLAAGDNAYSVSFDDDDKLTISADAAFDLSFDGTNKNTLLTSQLFFDQDAVDSKTSYTSDRVEYGIKKVTAVAGDDRLQTQKITCTGNTAHALAGKYFYLWSAMNTQGFYMWFSDGTGSDPGISGFSGEIVGITNGDTAAQVATALAETINGLGEFTASASGTVVTIVSALTGYGLPAREGVGTGFTFEVETYGQSEATDIQYIKVYSELGDRLFSKDSDLEAEEPGIRKYVKAGKNTFNDMHRLAQRKILEFLDRNGFVNMFQEKFTKWDLIDISEVSEWSRYMVMRMIFEASVTGKDDIFQTKRDEYEDYERDSRNRALLRIDVDKSKTLEIGEGLDIKSTRLFFR